MNNTTQNQSARASAHTPRTDAFCGQWVPRDKGSAGQQVSDFARELERELAETAAQRDELLQDMHRIANCYTPSGEKPSEVQEHLQGIARAAIARAEVKP